jgi:DNA-binding response OmpR family regulator
MKVSAMVGLFRARKKTSRARILVVGDEPDIVSVVEFRLKLANYSVVTAFSAKEGLGRAAAARPDLILVDVNAQGMNGHEMIERLRDDPALRHIPAISLTTRHEDEDRVVRACGASDSLAKPFDFRRLLDRIQATLKDREAPDGSHGGRRGRDAVFKKGAKKVK